MCVFVCVSVCVSVFVFVSVSVNGGPEFVCMDRSLTVNFVLSKSVVVSETLGFSIYYASEWCLQCVPWIDPSSTLVMSVSEWGY